MDDRSGDNSEVVSPQEVPPAPPAGTPAEQAPPAEAVTTAPASDLTVPVTGREPASDLTVPITARAPVAGQVPVERVPLPVGGPAMPSRPPAPRSTLAAALLNLTGLGLGYAYLRRWWRAGIALLGTALLVAAAFWTDAAASAWGWRGLFLVWLGAMVLDVTALAVRHPRPARPLVSVAAALAAVAAMVAGYLVYGAAGRGAYDDGVAAQASGDCRTAIDAFDTVTGRYELTLSATVAAAEARRTECEAYQRATGTPDHETAVARLLDFTERYPDSPLDTVVRDDLVARYDDWASALREDGDHERAIEVYRDRLQLRADGDVEAALADTYLELAASIPVDGGDVVAAATEVVGALNVVRTEFADTPAAAKVPATLAATYKEATKPYAAGRWCAALPALAYFAGLDNETAGAVAAQAADHHARSLLACGLAQLRGRDHASAQGSLEQFLTTYPRHPGKAQARSALIAAKVATAFGKAMRVPAPLGGNNPGPNPVVFYNDARGSAVTVRLTGPTAHEFTIPACGRACPANYRPGGRACPTYNGRPSVTLNLPAGRYHFTTDRSGGVTSLNDTVNVLNGFIHQNCLFVESLF